MNTNNYITATTWNALTDQERHAFANGLRFIGYRVHELWSSIHQVCQPHVLILDSYGDLVDELPARADVEYTRDDVLKFIQLTSFSFP